MPRRRRGSDQVDYKSNSNKAGGFPTPRGGHPTLQGGQWIAQIKHLIIFDRIRKSSVWKQNLPLVGSDVDELVNGANWGQCRRPFAATLADPAVNRLVYGFTGGDRPSKTARFAESEGE